MLAGPFTIFAPSNLALASLGQSTIASLKSDVGTLSNILKYHVVSGTLMASDLLVNELMLNSLTGQKLRVNYYRYNKVIRITIKSYMSVHVLLNLLSKLGKSDKMRNSPSILSLFRNEFNKLNNTGA